MDAGFVENILDKGEQALSDISKGMIVLDHEVGTVKIGNSMFRSERVPSIHRSSDQVSRVSDENLEGFKSRSGGKVRIYGRKRSDISDYYKIRILSHKDQEGGYYEMVIAYMSEPFAEEVASNWSALMNIETSTIDHILSTFGNASMKTLMMYRMMWDDNDPFAGRIVLAFDAEDSAYEDVTVPVRILQKLASPGIGELVKGSKIKTLTPPIPVAMDTANGCTISIGNIAEYSGVILKNVEVTWGNKLSRSDGQPVHADVVVQYQLVNPATKEDFEV